MTLSKSSKEALIRNVQNVYVLNVHSSVKSINAKWGRLVSDRKESMNFRHAWMFKEICVEVNALLYTYLSLKNNILYINQSCKLSKDDFSVIKMEERSVDYTVSLLNEYCVWAIGFFLDLLAPDDFKFIENNKKLFDRCSLSFTIPSDLETNMVAHKLSI